MLPIALQPRKPSNAQHYSRLPNMLSADKSPHTRSQHRMQFYRSRLRLTRRLLSPCAGAVCAWSRCWWASRPFSPLSEFRRGLRSQILKNRWRDARWGGTISYFQLLRVSCSKNDELCTSLSRDLQQRRSQCGHGTTNKCLGVFPLSCVRVRLGQLSTHVKIRVAT